MLYDHQNDISNLKLQIEAASKDAVEKCRAQESALKEDKADLKQQLRQQAIWQSISHTSLLPALIITFFMLWCTKFDLDSAHFFLRPASDNHI